MQRKLTSQREQLENNNKLLTCKHCVIFLNYLTKKEMDIKKGKIIKVGNQSKSPNICLIGIPKRENKKRK